MTEFENAVWQMVLRDEFRIKKRPMVIQLKTTLFPKSKEDFLYKAEAIIQEAIFTKIGTGRYNPRNYELWLWKQKPVARYGKERMAGIYVVDRKLSRVFWFNTADEKMREIKEQILYVDKFHDRPTLFQGRQELFLLKGGRFEPSSEERWFFKPEFSTSKKILLKETEENFEFKISKNTLGEGVTLGRIEGFTEENPTQRVTRERPRD